MKARVGRLGLWVMLPWVLLLLVLFCLRLLLDDDVDDAAVGKGRKKGDEEKKGRTGP